MTDASRRGWPAVVGAVVVAAAAALAACGVPTDGDVETLGTPPFGLLTTSTTTAQSTVPPDEGFSLTLYWATSDDEIVPDEPIGLPQTPTFQEVIDLLAEGPPVDDSTAPTSAPRSGSATTAQPMLRTYISEALNPEGEDGDHRAMGPLVVQVEDGILDLLVADRFREESQATPTRFRLAIAQVVCTVTQFENVTGVRFFDSRGQLTLVNLEQNPIEVATRENIGECEPRTQGSTRSASRRSSSGPTTTATTAAASSTEGEEGA